METYNKVKRDEVLVLTQKLIQIESVNPPGHVYDCAEFIRDWLINEGIDAIIEKFDNVDNVVAKIGPEGGKRILLNGHFDVVPIGDVNNWEYGPFDATYIDGKIYGRGAADMKSGVAAMMITMKVLNGLGSKLQGQVFFMGIGDEETGSHNGTLALLEKYGSNFDGAMVPEPTDLCIESAQRGLRWIEVTIKGKACHAGRPHVGKNAIEHAATIIGELKRIKFDAQHELFEEGLKEPSLSITMISGGIKENVIPEECKFIIDRRMMPGETEESILSEISQAIEMVAETGFVDTVKVVNKGWNPYVIDQGNPLLMKTIDSYKKVTNSTPTVRGKGGCTDASHLVDAGIPAIILGPGSANSSHTANESVDAERIALTAEIMIEAILEYFKH